MAAWPFKPCLPAPGGSSPKIHPIRRKFTSQNDTIVRGALSMSLQRSGCTSAKSVHATHMSAPAARRTVMGGTQERRALAPRETHRPPPQERTPFRNACKRDAWPLERMSSEGEIGKAYLGQTMEPAFSASAHGVSVAGVPTCPRLWASSRATCAEMATPARRTSRRHRATRCFAFSVRESMVSATSGPGISAHGPGRSGGKAGTSRHSASPIASSPACLFAFCGRPSLQSLSSDSPFESSGFSET
mmetsp:Transcript_48035/g.134086  ORF Transcript_48035/g.134086 Transcript_48035/m.134086 type:complete len:246 (+) Transcript_48035:70-807(+)